MTERVLLGMLTPSSNTVLEPVCAAMVAERPEISVHFCRFPVTEISLEVRALGQFDSDAMLGAAVQLTDARVQSICWSGTSAGWLGIAADRRLCSAIEGRTGVPATSSVLALADILRRTRVERLGLVTPYIDAIQDRIVENFSVEGFACVAERHLGLKENFSFSAVPAERIAAMVREVAAARPQAITIFCTNLRGAPIAEELEREIGIPIYDTVATGMWGALRAAGADPGVIEHWGRLFRDVTP